MAGYIAGSREKENTMDANRFDALARVMGTSPDRRNLLKAATAGALGLVGLSALSNSALAERCDTNRDCRGQDVCDKRENRCVECKRDGQCKRDERCNNRGKCVNE
jgi:hypothetical protein